jgi:hypothetical protein
MGVQMKKIILTSLFLIGSSAFATDILLPAGGSITLKAGDMATISCEAGSPVGGGQATVSAFCDGYNLYIELSGLVNDDSKYFSLSNSTTCQNAIKAIKPKLGDFSGAKGMSFCDGYNLYTVKVAASGQITSSFKSLSNATTCQNALNN